LESSIAKLGGDGIAYLQARTPQSGNAEAEVNISLSIAKLVLHGLEIDAEPIHQLFLEQAPEVRLEICLALGLTWIKT
jgi:hypothetical protein